MFLNQEEKKSVDDYLDEVINEGGERLRKVRIYVIKHLNLKNYKYMVCKGLESSFDDLFNAVYYDKIEVVAFLLGNGINPNLGIHKRTYLYDYTIDFESCKLNRKMVELLFYYGAKYSEYIFNFMCLEDLEYFRETENKYNKLT